MSAFIQMLNNNQDQKTRQSNLIMKTDRMIENGTKTACIYSVDPLAKGFTYIPKMFITFCPSELSERDLMEMIMRRFDQALKQNKNGWCCGLIIGFGVSASPMEVRQAWENRNAPVIPFADLYSAVGSSVMRSSLHNGRTV